MNFVVVVQFIETIKMFISDKSLIRIFLQKSKVTNSRIGGYVLNIGVFVYQNMSIIIYRIQNGVLISHFTLNFCLYKCIII